MCVTHSHCTKHQYLIDGKLIAGVTISSKIVHRGVRDFHFIGFDFFSVPFHSNFPASTWIAWETFQWQQRKPLTFSDPESSQRNLIPSSCSCCPVGTASSIRRSNFNPEIESVGLLSPRWKLTCLRCLPNSCNPRTVFVGSVFGHWSGKSII